jgi:hypothetical protein
MTPSAYSEGVFLLPWKHRESQENPKCFGNVSEKSIIFAAIETNTDYGHLGDSAAN